MKELLVIVPGSRTKSIPLLHKPLDAFYTHYGVTTVHGDWAKELKDYFDTKEKHATEVYYWSGGITKRLSLQPAARRLASFINEHEAYDSVTLLGKSLGGMVAELAVNHLTDNKRIRKVIYVATPHPHNTVTLPKHTQIVNVFSQDDNYLDFAIKVLYRNGSKVVENADNIVLHTLRHSDFSSDRKIQVDNKEITLFDFYEKIISST